MTFVCILYPAFYLRACGVRIDGSTRIVPSDEEDKTNGDWGYHLLRLIDAVEDLLLDIACDQLS
jgi:hypothetical protein